MLIKRVPRVPAYLIPDLSSHVARILEVDPTKDSAITIVHHCLHDVRNSPGDHLLDNCHITAELDVDLIATVPGTNDRAGCTSEGCVCGQIVLVIWGRIQERLPGWVGEVPAAG